MPYAHEKKKIRTSEEEEKIAHTVLSSGSEWGKTGVGVWRLSWKRVQACIRKTGRVERHQMSIPGSSRAKTNSREDPWALTGDWTAGVMDAEAT